jgi:hypothetical protein
MTDPQRIATPAHARHDTSIVATLAARPDDLDAAEAAAAREQVASCEVCADILADLIALQVALPATATPRRPRDFRLTPEDAQRLHRSGWRRFLGQIGSPRDGFSRPLAIGLTTLGLAGVLLASIPSMTLMAGAGGAAPSTVLAPINQAAPPPAGGEYASDRTSLEAAAAASGAPIASASGAPVPAPNGAASAAASASSDGQVFTGGNPDEVVPDITGEVDATIRDDASGTSVLFVVGGILLIAGLGLFILRWSARRLS